SVGGLAEIWDLLAGRARHARRGAQRDVVLGETAPLDAFLEPIATRTAAWALMTGAHDAFVGALVDGRREARIVSPLDGATAASSLVRRLVALAVLRTENRRARQSPRSREPAFGAVELARRANVPRNLVADLLSGRRMPRDSTLAAVGPVLWTAIVGVR